MRGGGGEIFSEVVEKFSEELKNFHGGLRFFQDG